MSSPGFVQLIITGVSKFAELIAFQQIFKAVGGKVKSANGEDEAQGLPAIIQAVSNLFNDKVDRDVKRAQIRKLDAETQKAQAEARKIEMEAQAFSLQNAAALIALGDKLTSGAEDAAALLEAKKTESERVCGEIERCQKKLAPVMESMGLQPPQIELPDNVIIFPKSKE